MLKHDHYTYRVTWSEEDGEYIGLCAEFPSLSWLASDPESALRGIRHTVADVAMDMQANGELVPVWPFIDAFLIGEGEEAILDIACTHQAWKQSGNRSRRE